MRLVPFTGWRCLTCGHMTDRGFPIMSCCERPVHLRVLVEEGRVSDDEREAIAAARRAAEENLCPA